MRATVQCSCMKTRWTTALLKSRKKIWQRSQDKTKERGLHHQTPWSSSSRPNPSDECKAMHFRPRQIKTFPMPPTSTVSLQHIERKNLTASYWSQHRSKSPNHWHLWHTKTNPVVVRATFCSSHKASWFNSTISGRTPPKCKGNDQKTYYSIFRAKSWARKAS